MEESKSKIKFPAKDIEEQTRQILEVLARQKSLEKKKDEPPQDEER